MNYLYHYSIDKWFINIYFLVSLYFCVIRLLFHAKGSEVVDDRKYKEYTDTILPSQ